MAGRIRIVSLLKFPMQCTYRVPKVFELSRIHMELIDRRERNFIR